MTLPTIIAYGRVSTSGQSERKYWEKQERALTQRFPTSTLDFAFDTCPGSTPLEDRSAFLAQFLKATRTGSPIWLDHPDRLLKSFDLHLIQSTHEFLACGGVPVRFLRPNTWIHQSISRLWASPSPTPHRHLALAQQLQRYLDYRSASLGSRSASVPVPPKLLWDNLRSLPHLPKLRACADLVLELARFPDLDRRFFYLDSYLGALYNQVAIRDRAVRGRQRAFSPGQRTYGERPLDLRIFKVVRQLESVPTFTRSGRPKRVPDQSIATALSALGYRNLHGRPFSKKNLWDLRRSPAYLSWKSGGIAVPTLPTLEELKS